MHQQTIEKIVEQDENLTEKYLEGKIPSIEELKVLRKAVIDFKLIASVLWFCLKKQGCSIITGYNC